MSDERTYTSKRYSILLALTQVFKQIDGTGDFGIKIWDNVEPKMVFWDEIEDYPAIRMSLGAEQRVYQGGGYKDRYLSITVRAYINDVQSQEKLELLLEDIETVIEQNGRLAYQDSQGVTQHTHDIRVISIDTDEGALAPIAVGEVLLQVHY